MTSNNGVENKLALRQEATELGFVSRDLVVAIGKRLELTYQRPKRKKGMSDQDYAEFCVQPHEFPTVVELAFAQGFNPLSKFFQYWKQKGQIQTMEHYTPLINWAQKLEGFTLETGGVEDEKLRKSLGSERDFMFFAKITKDKDKDSYQRLLESILKQALGAGLEFDEALKKADEFATAKYCIVAYGVCEYSEVFYEDSGKQKYGATPPGWVPGVTRAEIRAVRNTIKRAYGMPTPQEWWEMSFGKLDTQSVIESMAELPEGRDYDNYADEVIGNMARTKEIKAETAQMTPEEQREQFLRNVNLMRGPADEGAIGEDVVEGEFTEDEEEAFITPDPSRSLEETKAELVKHGYADDRFEDGDTLHDKLSRSVHMLQIGELDQLQRHNLIQYAARANVLKSKHNNDGESMTVARRLPLVPEFAASDDPPKTLKDALKTLKDMVVEATNTGEWIPDMKRVILDKE